MFCARPGRDLLAIEQHHAYRLHCIPGIWRRILEHLGSPEGEETTWDRCGSRSRRRRPRRSSCCGDQGRDPERRDRIFYGSTEAGTATTLDPVDVERKPSSVGVRATRRDPAHRGRRDLLSRADALRRLLREPRGDGRGLLVDGWYHSGDLVDLGDEGYVYVVGRAAA
ncbi:MAG: hypothetical protein U0W40_10900 [Acidimicrobiia bacterium]